MNKHINQPTGTFGMSNGVYDALRKIAQYWLPAAGTLYFALAGIWDLPYGEQIVGSIVALDIFLGVVLGYSNQKYKEEVIKYGDYDGVLVIDHTDPYKDNYSFELDTPIDQLEGKQTIQLRVDSH